MIFYTFYTEIKYTATKISSRFIFIVMVLVTGKLIKYSKAVQLIMDAHLPVDCHCPLSQDIQHHSFLSGFYEGIFEFGTISNLKR